MPHTNELTNYIKARLRLAAAADATAIASADVDRDVSNSWTWVQDGKLRREATLGLIKKATQCEEHAEGLLTWIAAQYGALPPLVDHRGGIYTSNGGGLVYLTECCRSTPTFSDSVLTCRTCYRDVPEYLLNTPEPRETDEIAPAKPN
jgi:hypothetical protein